MHAQAGVSLGTPALTALLDYRMKCRSGHYQVESVPCYCGETDHKVVTTRDRYGLDYRMVMCTRCGILYATPRLTESSLKEFYETDYRTMYTTHSQTQDEQFESGLLGSSTIAQLIDHYDRPQPKVVMELGCNTGSLLQRFQQDGATCYGVDYDEGQLEIGRAHGLDLRRGSVDTLESIGVKADLMILNHVIEHLTDLDGTLQRLRALLSPTGLMFVGCPGLFLWDHRALWQAAHTYQFTAETLTYVMECNGFQELYCDHHITSLWTLSEHTRLKADVARNDVKQIDNVLFGDRRRMPTLRQFNKFSVRQRKANLRANLRRGLPSIVALEGQHKGQPAVILGGGPSLDGQLETVKALQAQGHLVLAIERLSHWCLQHGVIPDYLVTMDASDDVVEALQQTPDTVHLVATQVQPSVLDALQGQPAYLYHTPQRDIDTAQEWHDAGIDEAPEINGGGSVTMVAMGLASFFGCTELHIFGFDCHVTDGGYVNGIVGVGEQEAFLDVMPTGQTRIYRTTAAYYSFAQQFGDLMWLAKQEQAFSTVWIYGDSLASALLADGPHCERLNGVTRLDLRGIE